MKGIFLKSIGIKSPKNLLKLLKAVSFLLKEVMTVLQLTVAFSIEDSSSNVTVIVCFCAV